MMWMLLLVLLMKVRLGWSFLLLLLLLLFVRVMMECLALGRRGVVQIHREVISHHGCVLWCLCSRVGLHAILVCH
jgi:hypothetical protein